MEDVPPKDVQPNDALPMDADPMDADPRDAMRASDADRTVVADRLRMAVEEGRLSALEYDDRLGKAYAAMTYGELAPLTADLPDLPAPVAPVPSPARVHVGVWLASVRSWLAGNVFFIALWAWGSIASHHLIFFWPAFFMLFTAAAAVRRGLHPNNQPRLPDE